MARISTYVVDGTIVDDDKVIGSDANNDMVTKNYKVGDLVAYFAVAIGDYLVPYNNATDDVDLGPYSLFATNLSISGTFTADGTAGLPGQVLMSQGGSSPAVWAYNIGSQDLEDVLNNGNTGNKSIYLYSLGSTILIDVEASALLSTGIYLLDQPSGRTSTWLTNEFNLYDGSNSFTQLIDRTIYSNGTNSINIVANNYNNQTFLYPNYGGAFVMSVNGVFADMSGNVNVGGSGGGGVIQVNTSSPITGGPITATGTIGITKSDSTTDGYLSSTDWSTFNSKGNGTVTGVTATTPLSSTGGITPDISISQADTTTDGYLSSTDWNTFNNKLGSVPDLQQVTDVGNTTTNTIELISNTVDEQTTLTNTYVSVFNDFDTEGISIYKDKIIFATNDTNDDPYSIILKPKFFTGFTSDQTIYLPQFSGTLPIKVNGNYANTSGEITITVGTVTDVTATSPITSSGGTTPVISTSMSTNKLIGRSTTGTGVMEEITIGSGLSLSAGTLTSTATGGSILHGTAAGTDTYTTTITGAPTSYSDGDAYLVRFTNGNTAGCTLNINALGAKVLYRNNDGVLIGGDIQAGAEMLCIYNTSLDGGNGGFQCIGTSPNTLLAYVTNDDSVTITKGQPVYAFSGTGDRMTVKLAYNTGDSTSAQTVGLVFSPSIGAGQKGIIIIQGLLDGLSNVKPANGWADGSAVYLGTTAGSITPTKQLAPNHLVYLGFVTTASPGAAGRIYVRVQNGFEMDELHNVQAQSPTLKDTLWYDSGVSPGQWKTASISTILGYTPVNPSRSIGTTSPLSGGGDLSADRTLSISQANGSTNGYLSSTDWTTFNGKQNALTNPITGTGTNNELAYFNATGSTISSLTTATYPSLTELSYVKGVTSGIQTQIDGKQTDTAWVNCSSQSISGWASTTTKLMQYKLLGNKTMIFQFSIVGTGTSGGTASITLPFTSSTWGEQTNIIRSRTTATLGIGISTVAASSTTLNLYPSAAMSTWNINAQRDAHGTIIINLA